MSTGINKVLLIHSYCVFLLLFLQNDEQMSLSSPVDSQFFRMLMEEEGNNMRELLDAEEYLVPQPNLFPRTQGDGIQANGPSRHQSYRVSGDRQLFVLDFYYTDSNILLLVRSKH